jgi:very-short-patch-repair endonuclease
VAIELDGAQHLADADAYRRDRCKDRLLQENDYFVLRLLAEDVGKDLDPRVESLGKSFTPVTRAAIVI